MTPDEDIGVFIGVYNEKTKLIMYINHDLENPSHKH